MSRTSSGPCARFSVVPSRREQALVWSKSRNTDLIGVIHCDVIHLWGTGFVRRHSVGWYICEVCIKQGEDESSRPICCRLCCDKYPARRSPCSFREATKYSIRSMGTKYNKQTTKCQRSAENRQPLRHRFAPLSIFHVTMLRGSLPMALVAPLRKAKRYRGRSHCRKR